MSQLTRAKKTKVASKSRLNFGLPHDHFFLSVIRNMNSSTPSGRNNALFYAPKKSPKWGELLQFRVDAVVNGKLRLGRRIGFDQNASAAWRFKPLTLCRDNGSRLDRCRLQIINRAPIAGCDERGGSFPWAFTRGIIDHFFPSPEEIANAQSPGDLAPIRRALHQLCKPVVGIGVFEPLCPKMSWITEHNFPALKQERMIINRIGGESGFYR